MVQFSIGSLSAFCINHSQSLLGIATFYYLSDILTHICLNAVDSLQDSSSSSHTELVNVIVQLQYTAQSVTIALVEEVIVAAVSQR